jgi:predicted nuclease of predicted toxin-antitoxin system
MSLILYKDENVPLAIATGLRRRGVEVHTVAEEGQRETPDPEILDRALMRGWVVFTMDEDFLREARSRNDTGNRSPV